MTNKARTDAEIDAAYAEIAADRKREAEERLALDAAIRKTSRRILSPTAGLDSAGNPIPGMWSVVLSTGAPYETPYQRGVGLFKTLAGAENYCDAYDKEANAASAKAPDQYETTFCNIQFIPFGDTEPVFHTLYTVETERDDDPDQRKVTDISAEVISEKELLKMIHDGDPLIAAIWEDRSLAVVVDHYGNEKSKGVVSSSVFGPVETVTGEYGDGTPFTYTETTEHFLTFDPENVVLANPAKA